MLPQYSHKVHKLERTRYITSNVHKQVLTKNIVISIIIADV